MINIQHRNNITDLLPPNSIGCELGVFEGCFSEQLLLSNKFKELYLVDLFSGEASNFGKHYRDSSVLYDIVTNKFKDNSNVKVVKEDSISFLQSTTIIFDFIYIDTIHSYDHLIQELTYAHNRIKKNGFICGHDYCLEFNGVIKAVDEFARKHNYTTSITKENNYPSFIIRL
jgi:hypothetical protein